MQSYGNLHRVGETIHIGQNVVSRSIITCSLGTLVIIVQVGYLTQTFYVESKIIHNQRINSKKLEWSHCILHRSKKNKFHMIYSTHSKQIYAQDFPNKRSFLLAENSVLLQNNPTLLCASQKSFLYTSHLYLYKNQNSSWCDLSFTLTLGISKFVF